jgi:branched-chain amino acid transport system permease protein
MLIELILQQIISGLAIGSMYSLVAMGYSMIWGAMEIVNFAQGELFMLGAVFGVILFKVFHIPFIITFAITLLLLAIIGIVVRLVIVKPLREKEHLMVIIATASLSIVIKTSTIVWWGPEGTSFPSIFGDKPMEIMRLIVVPQNIWIIGISLFVMLTLHIFLKNTRTGIEMRAVAQDRLAARVIGVSIDKTDTLTFATNILCNTGYGNVNWIKRIYCCNYWWFWEYSRCNDCRAYVRCNRKYNRGIYLFRL